MKTTVALKQKIRTVPGSSVALVGIKDENHGSSETKNQDCPGIFGSSGFKRQQFDGGLHGSAAITYQLRRQSKVPYESMKPRTVEGHLKQGSECFIYFFGGDQAKSAFLF
jgi:hypothetical protein